MCAAFIMRMAQRKSAVGAHVFSADGDLSRTAACHASGRLFAGGLIWAYTAAAIGASRSDRCAPTLRVDACPLCACAPLIASRRSVSEKAEAFFSRHVAFFRGRALLPLLQLFLTVAFVSLSGRCDTSCSTRSFLFGACKRAHPACAPRCAFKGPSCPLAGGALRLLAHAYLLAVLAFVAPFAPLAACACALFVARLANKKAGTHFCGIMPRTVKGRRVWLASMERSGSGCQKKRSAPCVGSFGY